VIRYVIELDDEQLPGLIRWLDGTHPGRTKRVTVSEDGVVTVTTSTSRVEGTRLVDMADELAAAAAGLGADGVYPPQQ